MDKKLLSLLIAACLGLSVSTANAALYTFTETGFTDGATITGSFEGTDLNLDGFISGASFTNLDEISSFNVSFSGNALVSAFSQTYTDLTYFGFDIARSVLGNADGEGIATNWFGGARYQFLTGYAVNGAVDGYVIDTLLNVTDHTSNIVSVTPAAVPVPSAVWLFGSALAGFLSLKRRQA